MAQHPTPKGTNGARDAAPAGGAPAEDYWPVSRAAAPVTATAPVAPAAPAEAPAPAAIQGGPRPLSEIIAEIEAGGGGAKPGAKGNAKAKPTASATNAAAPAGAPAG